MRDMWSLLEAQRCEVVLTGHDHLYERFARQLATAPPIRSTAFASSPPAPAAPSSTTLSASRQFGSPHHQVRRGAIHAEARADRVGVPRRRRLGQRSRPRHLPLGDALGLLLAGLCTCGTITDDEFLSAFALLSRRLARRARAAEAAGAHTHTGTRRCRQAARRRRQDRIGPGLEGAAARQGQGQARPPTISSPCITPAGRPTARCSTARSRATRRSTLPARSRHQGLGRRRAADGRRREAPLLDSAGARLQRHGRAGPRACSCSTSSCSRSVRTRARRRPTSRRRPPTPRRPPPASPTSRCAGQGRHAPSRRQHASPCTTRVDDRRQAVRQLGRQGPANHVSAWAKSSTGWTEGVQLMRGREDAVLDSREARLQGPGARRPARLRRRTHRHQVIGP